MPDRPGVQREQLQPEGHRRAVVRRGRRRRVQVAEGRARPRHAHRVDGRRLPGAGREPRRRQRPGRRHGARRGAARAARDLQGVPPRRHPDGLRRRVCDRGRRRRHRGRRRRAVPFAGRRRRDPRDAARREGRDHRGVLRGERRPRAAVRRQHPAVAHHGGRRHRGSHLPDSRHTQRRREAGGTPSIRRHCYSIPFFSFCFLSITEYNI